MKTLIFTLTLLLFTTVIISAQEGYTVRQDTLQSNVLKQTRKITIYLPQGYNSSNTTTYPVIYMIDGEWRSSQTGAVARLLEQNQKMPKVILVGVINIDRNHDFLPSPSPGTPTGGGADNFIQFFKNELIPYIDKNFKTSPYKVFLGHSFGGLLVINTFLSNTELFDSYIAMDPSVWYNNLSLINTAKAELPKTKNWNKTIFITGRDRGGMEEMGITSLQELLKKIGPVDLNWKIVSYSNETHNSLTFLSAFDGLRFVFDVPQNFIVYPSGGTIPKSTEGYLYVKNNNSNLRYTTNGSEPTKKSELCPNSIKIKKACVVKIKSVGSNYNETPTVTRVFLKGKFLEGEKTIENLKPGLKYSYFEGTWDTIPDFAKLVSVKSGTTDSIDLKIGLKKDSFAVQFEGYLHITKKQLYNLYIDSDGGSRVFLNNEILLNNDGLLPKDPVIKIVPLKPGHYPIFIQYFQRTNKEYILFGTKDGNKKAIPFPKEMFFYKD